MSTRVETINLVWAYGSFSGVTIGNIMFWILDGYLHTYNLRTNDHNVYTEDKRGVLISKCWWHKNSWTDLSKIFNRFLNAAGIYDI